MKARVIGSLKSGFIDVLAGYNLGQLNGGTVQRIAVEHSHWIAECQILTL
jgi:hypothetical protein